MFEHPANPFVMDFLGNVNVFHGRVQNGHAVVGNVTVEYPEYPHAEPQAATLVHAAARIGYRAEAKRRAGIAGQCAAREPDRLGGSHRVDDARTTIRISKSI